MKLKQNFRSRVLNLAFSEGVQNLRRRLGEARRRLSRQPHVVSVFLELDDPYSYVLSHYLPELAAYYDVELRLYLTEAVTEAYRPAPELYPEYAVNDCRQLARELGIPFLDKGSAPPVEHRVALLNALAVRAPDAGSDKELLEAIAAYWRGDSEGVARRADGSAPHAADALLQRNQKRLRKLGHYNTAMLHYGGEWYWGVDRLHYLTQRLAKLGLQDSSGVPPKIASIEQLMHVDLPIRPPAAAKDFPPLEFFFSFRSPYSYLALRRAIAIADAFGVAIQFRPVLPMVKRGMQVPRPKLLYIAADSSREARRLGVPYGKMADPLGAGVERCLAVWHYAVSEKRERDFIVAACEAIWSEAIDVSTDAGLRKVTAKAGLFWPEASAAVDNDAWRQIANDNRASMMESGSWGVPTMRLGDFATWGQDRDWLLIRHMEDLCETGDGILI